MRDLFANGFTDSEIDGCSDLIQARENFEIEHHTECEQEVDWDSDRNITSVCQEWDKYLCKTHSLIYMLELCGKREI